MPCNFQTVGALLVASAMLLNVTSCSESNGKEDSAAKTDSVQAPIAVSRVMGVARIEPENGIQTITAGTTGKVLNVLIDENQDVVGGQSLINVAVAVETAQLAQAQSKLATQQASIAARQARLNGLNVDLQKARDTYERNRQLIDAKAQTKQALDESKAALDRLVTDVASAQADVLEATNRLNELRADITYYRTVVGQKKVAVPQPGRILKVTINPGDYVTDNTQIAEFAAAGPLFAKTEVDELYADRVKTGQRAALISQTTGDTLARGTVSFTADYLRKKSLFNDQNTEQEDRRVREVHIRLEPGRSPLIGSRVDCLILL
ncbi:HlyD family efflux transporter periplasmic adaptor subunit [Fibrisoma montanum]|uniref:HlyD family efflux transporter periplasmic adaptor subunit n=1 Tax=Fibrisoma montanum TaxID=2305895 RepID=A0A418MI19_9BACT|nr:efflux RND transporter periplasmic adaptor subunit [Fibrisoma montanum]RIV27075.1 HlyD family efflux transporter periplasmic adaptor subunit [Fibrisoma montanum]